jgi:hypothetical protein
MSNQLLQGPRGEPPEQMRKLEKKARDELKDLEENIQHPNEIGKAIVRKFVKLVVPQLIIEDKIKKHIDWDQLYQTYPYFTILFIHKNMQSHLVHSSKSRRPAADTQQIEFAPLLLFGVFAIFLVIAFLKR